MAVRFGALPTLWLALIFTLFSLLLQPWVHYAFPIFHTLVLQILVITGTLLTPRFVKPLYGWLLIGFACFSGLVWLLNK